MKKTLSVIIAAHNEAKTIGPLVRRLCRWYRRPEVIVIANGCTDRTASIARGAGARVVRFKNRLGPDVGRAVGLSIARGDICLVVDGDMIVPPAQLEPFVRAVQGGVDIALNGYPFPGTKKFHHPTAIAKHALNIFADRADLRAASLTTVPHAISRRAIKLLGPLAFCVPPVAQARAICDGRLRIEIAGQVAVGALNRSRGAEHDQAMRRLIIGDCLEGVNIIIDQRGVRGGFTDLGRKRDLAQGASFIPKERVSAAAIVPTQGEAGLTRLVGELTNAPFDHIRLVLNGANEEDIESVRTTSTIEVDYFAEPVGHDVGRAIGCMQVDSDKYFITDADIPLTREDVEPFLDAIDRDVDIALNNLDRILSKARQVDPPSIVKRFLNIACDRPDLGVSSLTAVPHAISGRILREIGFESIAVPPLGQVKAILAGLHVEAVHPVDVVKMNAVRPHLHNADSGKPLQKLIVGDHLEAIAYLQEVQGSRGNFPDPIRRIDLAERYIM
ncbi:glycosyltransferase family 2 protein [Alicyclobacillus dauci]|uniref:Glucosyl-3-phosphoglycerate synthase n=1 Tax=Alicyclobacillus dauci TaxID=1475485 RepID=A0ABY6Z1A9_9BACL|nr:glycosyltransferase family 2 protein [Alicyclobacillus dauci]WAH36632.1 glycosyltransferase family 2 protein [Alicyclobacillus dauci]